MTWANKLYFGDNLNTLGHKISKESVNLFVLEPPSNSRVDDFEVYLKMGIVSFVGLIAEGF